MYPMDELDPTEGSVLPKTRKKVAGGALTQDAQSGSAYDMLLKRYADLSKQSADLDAQPEDMSQFQEYARKQGVDGDWATLNALAAGMAGERFQPLQAQLLKKAAAAAEPMKVSGGVLTPDGKFLKDPTKARDDRRTSLNQQQNSILTLLEKADTARERRDQQSADAARADDTRRFLGQLSADTRAAIAAGNRNATKAPSGYRMTADGNLEAIPGGPADTKLQGVLNADTAALQSSGSALDRLEAAANAVQNHPGLKGITGLRGVIPNVPGSNAANAQALLEQLRSQAGFAVLQAMRDASKSGGALGQVSNFELQALQNNLAALQNAQSYEQIVEELGKIQEFSRGAKGRLQAAYNMKHSGGAAPASAQPESTSSGAPAPGTVKGGYRFKGGNPADKNNWEKM